MFNLEICDPILEKVVRERVHVNDHEPDFCLNNRPFFEEKMHISQFMSNFSTIHLQNATS